MARPLRMFIPGYAYHIISRGNERKNIYRDSADRKKFLKIVEEASEKYQFIVLSYVLMSNHYHFLIEIKLANMSRAMQEINTNYSVYFNRKYRRSGHLLHGRFKSVLVEHGQELKFVTAYIHLNPARAGMVDKLIDYRYSSHRQYTGGVSKGVAKPAHILNLFSRNRKEAMEKYEKYVKEVAIFDIKDLRKRMYGDYVMGSESFVRNIKLMFKDKNLSKEIADRKKIRKIYKANDIIKAVKESYKVEEDELMHKKSKWNKGKRILIYLLITDAGLTYADVGRMLGDLSSANVSRVYKRVSNEIAGKRSLRKNVFGIKKKYVKEAA